MNRVAWKQYVVFLAFSLIAAACGSEGDDCDIELPAPFNGQNGEQVSLSLTDGESITCTGIETGGMCNFSVNFVVTGLQGLTTARLLVELIKTDDGDDFCDDPFPQGSGVAVSPGQGGGQLAGVLGPPVSRRVRFNLAVELLDSQGSRIAVSQQVRNLRPT